LAAAAAAAATMRKRGIRPFNTMPQAATLTQTQTKFVSDIFWLQSEK